MTLRILVLVKGNKAAALAEAKRRSIVATFLKYLPKTDETWLQVDEAERAKVSDWYEDYSQSIDTPGSCLSLEDA